MGSNGAPFGGKGRPINPRFSLNNEPEGVDTDEFSPKGSIPERARRSVPKPFGQAEDSSPVFFPTGSRDRHASPNSMFSGEDDGLSLDIGVNETDSETVPVPPARDIPRVEVKPVPPTMIPAINEGRGFHGGFGQSSEMDDDDELSLDIGVNETDTVSSWESKTVSSPSAPAPVSSPEQASPAPQSITPVLPVTPSILTPPVTSESVGEDANTYSNETEKEDELSSGQVGFSENAITSTVSETISTPVLSPIPSIPTVPHATEKVIAPAVRPVSPKVRSVNPLFADPVEDENDDELSLDVGVNETEDKPAKRVISPLFDFKSDGFTPPKRKPDARRIRPDAMIDTGDAESFDAEKKSRKSVKKDEPKRRPFQIQERDITLLRFLTKYQFSYVDAIARVLNSTPASINKRLRTLEEYELVKRQNIAAGSTLWQTRKSGIELAGLVFKENKRSISFATIRHTIGLVNLAAELEREAPGAKDILGLGDKFGEMFPVLNRFPGGIRLYGEEALETPLTFGEMTVSEREIRQGQKRYRGGRSSAEMRDIVELAIDNPDAPELEPGNEGLFVVYGHGGKTGEHVPDLVVSRPRGADGRPQHFAIELELTPKSPGDWKRILRSYRENGGMYSRIYYFTSERAIANMIRNADSDVGLGDRLVLRRYTPKNKRQPFLG